MLRRTALASVAVLLAAACSSAPPTLRIVRPRDGDVVHSPFRVEAEVSGFELQTAGSAVEGAGHLHVLIDVGCAEPASGIPSDERHIHLWRAERSVELDLPPGEHEICVQAGDGGHVALDLSKEFTVTVAG